MRTYTGSTWIQRSFAVSIPVLAAVWLITVPTVVAMSTFFALLGLMVGVLWVAKLAYGNGQPAASVAQLLHDTERGSTVQHPRDNK